MLEHPREVGDFGQVGPVTRTEHHAVDSESDAVGQQDPQLIIADRGNLDDYITRARLGKPRENLTQTSRS